MHKFTVYLSFISNGFKVYSNPYGPIHPHAEALGLSWASIVTHFITIVNKYKQNPH